MQFFVTSLGFNQLEFLKAFFPFLLHKISVIMTTMKSRFSDLFSQELPFSFDTSQPFWQALVALDLFFEGQSSTQSPQAEISPKAELIRPETITICAGAKIEAGAQIVGPAYIGPNAIVSHGALVRSGTLLLEGARVGHCSEVKRSILMPHSKAAHFNYVGDSILGQNVNLGAGTVLCNLRLDKRAVRVEGISTGAVKLGAAVGDDASLGAGVICNPGAVIEKKTFVRPKSIVTGLYSREAQLQ